MEKGGKMKQYYRTISNSNKVETWHGDPARATWLLQTNKLVIPLGTHKPKNLSQEDIKQF